MSQISVKTHRFDPYKNFKFRLKLDGRSIAGISNAGALKRTTEVVKHRKGGEPSATRKSLGITDREAVTPEPGVTHSLELHRRPRSIGLLVDFRKDLLIKLYNEARAVVITQKIFRCWVCKG